MVEKQPDIDVSYQFQQRQRTLRHTDPFSNRLTMTHFLYASTMIMLTVPTLGADTTKFKKWRALFHFFNPIYIMLLYKKYCR